MAALSLLRLKSLEPAIKSEKPGWVSFSMHPTTTNAEAGFIVEAIAALASHHREWSADYSCNPHTNEFTHRVETGAIGRRVQHWFDEFGRSVGVASEWEPMGLGFEI